MNQKTILIVEDEVIIGMDIRRTLMKLGYEVPNIIANAEKAIKESEKKQPDLILMDIMLKGKMDGISAAEIIRNKFQIPVVYLTAHTDTSTLERAKKTQPFGYIVKPFEERELHTTVEIALARSEAEKKMRQALQKEKELNELKSRFISMVSHEFRTPLATILFSIGILEKYSIDWTEEKKLNHIHKIQTAVNQMTNLLEDILTIGKSEAGKIELNPVLLDLKKFCYDLVEDIKSLDQEQHQINFKYVGEKHGIIDDKLLQKILGNLLNNAVKYSPDHTAVEFSVILGKEPVELTEYLSEEQIEKLTHYPVAVFQIKDQGLGIPEEDQKYLFEMFHRAKNVGSITGSGLGLAIVKNSVQSHSGEIYFQSTVGKGTDFTVIIPIFCPDCD
jgi:signal transduction histidine kinase